MGGAFKSLDPGGKCCPEGAVCENPQAIPHDLPQPYTLDEPVDPIVNVDNAMLLPSPFPIDFGCALSELEITDDRCRSGTVAAAGVVAPRNSAEGDSCFPILKLDIHGMLICTSVVASVVVEKRYHPSDLPELSVVQGEMGAPQDAECASAMCLKLELPDVRCETPRITSAEVIPMLDGPSGKMRARATAGTVGTRGFKTRPSSEWGCGTGDLAGPWKKGEKKDGYETWNRIEDCGVIYAETKKTDPPAWIFAGNTGRPSGWRPLSDGPFGGYYAYVTTGRDTSGCTAGTEGTAGQDPDVSIASTAAHWPLPAETSGELLIHLVRGSMVGGLQTGKCGSGTSQIDPDVFIATEDPCNQDWNFEVVVPWAYCTSPDIHTTVGYGTSRASAFKVTVSAGTAQRPQTGVDGYPKRDTAGNVLYDPMPDPCNLSWFFDVLLPDARCERPTVRVTTSPTNDFNVTVTAGTSGTSGVDWCIPTWEFTVPNVSCERPTINISTGGTSFDVQVSGAATTSGATDWCLLTWDFVVPDSFSGTSGTSGTSGERGSDGTNGTNGSDGQPGQKYAIVPIGREWVGFTCMEAAEALFFDRLTFEFREATAKAKIPFELIEACEPGSLFVASAVSSRPETVGAVIRDGHLCIERANADVATVTIMVAGVRKGCGGRYPRFGSKAAEHNDRFWRKAVDPSA